MACSLARPILCARTQSARACVVDPVAIRREVGNERVPKEWERGQTTTTTTGRILSDRAPSLGPAVWPPWPRASSAGTGAMHAPKECRGRGACSRCRVGAKPLIVGRRVRGSRSSNGDGDLLPTTLGPLAHRQPSSARLVAACFDASRPPARVA
jgi:hypothetical protein